MSWTYAGRTTCILAGLYMCWVPREDLVEPRFKRELNHVVNQFHVCITGIRARGVHHYLRDPYQALRLNPAGSLPRLLSRMHSPRFQQPRYRCQSLRYSTNDASVVCEWGTTSTNLPLDFYLPTVARFDDGGVI
jgi:hypothetical protein